MAAGGDQHEIGEDPGRVSNELEILSGLNCELRTANCERGKDAINQWKRKSKDGIRKHEKKTDQIARHNSGHEQKERKKGKENRRSGRKRERKGRERKTTDQGWGRGRGRTKKKKELREAD